MNSGVNTTMEIYHFNNVLQMNPLRQILFIEPNNNQRVAKYTKLGKYIYQPCIFINECFFLHETYYVSFNYSECSRMNKVQIDYQPLPNFFNIFYSLGKVFNGWCIVQASSYKNLSFDKANMFLGITVGIFE